MTDSNFTKTFTTDNFTQFVNNTNTIGKEVGGLARLTTTVDSDLVGAINELDSDIGARPHTTLNTNSKTITGAVNEIHTAGNASLVGLTPDSANKLGGFNDSAERTTVGGALNSLSADVRILDSDIGSARAKTTLSTTSKNIVGGINELDAEMGAASLNTSATTVKGAINELESNHDSAVGQLKTDIGNVFRYQTISGDTGSDTVDSANGSLAIVGDGIIQTTMSGNRLLVDHTVVGATDVNNSGKTYVQDITMDSAGHVTAIGSTAISGLVNDDVAAGAGINAEKIADGSISNTEFQALNGITGNIQTQLDSANSTQFFVKAGSGSTEQINNNETLTFTGSGGTSIARSGNEFTVSSTSPSNSTVTISAGSNLSGGGSFTLNGGGGSISLSALAPPLAEGTGPHAFVANSNSTTGLFSDDGRRRFRFNNASTGHRTMIFGGDNGYGAISLVPNDTSTNINNYGPYLTIFKNGTVKGSFGTSTTTNSYDAHVARAFANYNGASNYIRGSRNCSSVTDYGTGNYRFNWSSEPNAAHSNISGAYSWAGSTRSTSTVHPGVSVALHPSYSLANSYTHVCTGTGGGVNSQGFFFDLDYTCVITFA